MTHLLLAAASLPVLLALGVAVPGRVGRFAMRIAPWAGLPVLVLAALPLEYPAIRLAWLMLGAEFRLDEVGRIFLLFSAFLWCVSGVYAASYVAARKRTFFLFYLLAMAGNLGLPIAADAVTFYLFFAVMTFAAYGLVVHAGHAEARRAGRVYMALAVVGEISLLVGLLLAVEASGSITIAALPAGVGGSMRAGTITAFLLLGFGIKAGAVPLHVWLPLAHPVAPTPASAVLSGSMIKAGVLGWIRFLPLGETSLPGWGATVLGVGIAAAFFGVAMGILQTEAKTVLAYSSISQMGLMNVGVGIALAAPEAAPAAVAAVALYAAHHGLAKGALFLGLGVTTGLTPHRLRGALVRVGFLLPALAVAGAPLTGGSVAKGELKALFPYSPPPWPEWLEWLLPISAVATTALMARFLIVAGVWQGAGHPRAAQTDRTASTGSGLALPWAVLLVGVAGSLWLLPRFYPLGGVEAPRLQGLGAVAVDIIPLVAGILLAWTVIAVRSKYPRAFATPSVEAGDLLIPLERLGRALTLAWPRPAGESRRDVVSILASRWYRVYAASDRHDLLLRLELLLTGWTSGIFLLLALLGAVLLLLARGA